MAAAGWPGPAAGGNLNHGHPSHGLTRDGHGPPSPTRPGGREAGSIIISGGASLTGARSGQSAANLNCRVRPRRASDSESDSMSAGPPSGGHRDWQLPPHLEPQESLGLSHVWYIHVILHIAVWYIHVISHIAVWYIHVISHIAVWYIHVISHIAVWYIHVISHIAVIYY